MPQPIPSSPSKASPLPIPRSGDTRTRILQAAERLFAECGFEGASMRALARAAGASLSSTNYHFGTKEALVEAVLRQRAEPLNAIRLERLGAAEHEGGAVAIDVILDAFVRPLFDMRAMVSTNGTEPGWLAARLFSDPAPVIVRIRSELFGEVDARFLAALSLTLPNVERREIEIAYQLTNGLLIHFASGRILLGEVEMGAGEDTSARVLEALLDYAGAGLHRLARESRQVS